MSEPQISYSDSERAWLGFRELLESLVARHGLRSVCDVGGGANPIFDPGYVDATGLDYSILDISRVELGKAPGEFAKIEADIASPEFSLESKFDLVFSKMVAEHVRDARRFHSNVWSILTDGGFAVHFFPTLYTLPFLVNHLTPSTLSQKLLTLLAPRDEYRHAKFPAYYRWCRGPTETQFERFESVGFEVVEYRGFFGHAGYYKRVAILRKLHELKSRLLLQHPSPHLTSYAIVVLRKIGGEMKPD